ncbi:translocase, partial [Acinetobacter baumannii]
IMHIVGRQKQMLLLTLTGFILRIGILYGQFYLNPTYLLEAYAISGGIFYGICYIVFSNSAGLEVKDHILLVKKVGFLLIFITSLGVMVNITLRVLGL